MKTTVGSTVHPNYRGTHEWEVRGVAELKQPVMWHDPNPERGHVRYDPKIMLLEAKGVGKVLWFNYWISTSKTGEKMRWGGGPPMLEEDVFLELLKGGINKGLFGKTFLKKLNTELQLALE